MGRTRRSILALEAAGVASLVGCVSVPSRTSRDPFDAGDIDATVGFVGDVMLGRNVTQHWTGKDPEGVWGSTLERLQGLDGLAVNLECCVSRRGNPWPTKTYSFRADPGFAVPALEAADVSVASLANNHTLDFRAVGLRDTLDHLEAAGVAHAGAGPDRDAAFAPAVVDAGGLTVAVVALTNRWPAYAAIPNGAGTAYTRLSRNDPATRARIDAVLDQVADRDPDLLVASLHWGPNWDTSPTDSQVDFGRWLIERGFDVVHGHSAHVLQGVEVYRGRPIIYDAGDFVDDYVQQSDVQNKRSALFELVVTDGRLDRLRVRPTEIGYRAATMADPEASEWVRETVRERSEALGTKVKRTGGTVSIPLGAE